MQNISIKQNALLAAFLLVSSLSCIAFENSSCMNQDGSYDVPVVLFKHLLSVASPNGLQPRGYDRSTFSIKKASAAFELYLMSYMPQSPEPTVKVHRDDLGLLMLSFDENYRRNMQQRQFEQKKAEVAGFNPPYVFSVEDNCGPDQYANWMLEQDN